MGYKFLGHSFVDAPTSAAIVYTHGCNLTCQYCYNLELLKPESPDDLTLEETIQKIRNLQQINKQTGETYTTVDWLIISGGEPLCTETSILDAFISTGKSIGLKIGLYTNFTLQSELTKVIDKLDFLHIDYKDDSYDEDNLKRVYELYAAGKLEYLQFNTTLCKSIHTREMLERMMSRVPFVKPKISDQLKSTDKRAWTLTSFFNNNDTIRTLGDLKSAQEIFTKDEIKSFLDHSLFSSI
jgi:organic radical activating enzyme